MPEGRLALGNIKSQAEKSPRRGPRAKTTSKVEREKN
jgi:hypothetical protein